MIDKFLLLLVCVFVIGIFSGETYGEVLDPVIFFHGLGAGQLEVKTDDLWEDCYWSSKLFHTIWLNLPEILLKDDCFFKLLSLQYDGKNNSWSDAPGAKLNTVDFGGVKGIDYLDSVFGVPIRVTSVINNFINALKKEGYRMGKNFRGAPYDWRLPPYFIVQHTSYGDKLKEMVEETYVMNNNSSMWFIAHSNGGLVAQEFLADMDPEWIDKYVKGVISVVVPFGGISGSIKAVLSGDNFGISVLDEKHLLPATKTLGSVYFDLPRWGTPQEELIFTQNQNYTFDDLYNIFVDSKNDDAQSIIKNQPDRTLKPIDAYPVKKHICFYGVGSDTEYQYYYDSNDWTKAPSKIIYTDGDSRVPAFSASLCTQFDNAQVFKIPGMTHRNSLQDHLSIDMVLDIITSDD